MSRKVDRLIPFDVNEVLFVTRIVKMMGRYTKENVPMSSGQFSAIKLKTDVMFYKDDIQRLQKEFSKRYDTRLKFETQSQGMITVGYLTKT